MKSLDHYGPGGNWSARLCVRVALLVSLILVATPWETNAQVGTLRFASGFEPNTALASVNQVDCWATGCWQGIEGTDSTTGYTWPPVIWGGAGHLFMLADAPVDAITIRNYLFNQIVTLTGHGGSPSRALYRQITQSGCCGQDKQGGGAAQNSLQIYTSIGSPSEETDLYISYWIKFQPGMDQIMEVGTPGNGWNWRSIFGWKTNGDYRVTVSVMRDPFLYGGNLFWRVLGDNEANGGLPYKKFWEVVNSTVPVPVGKWFKFEVFWHRSSGGDGRVWVAVDGQVIANRFGRNMASSNPLDPEYAFLDSPRAIDRIYVSSLYSSTTYPIYQWMDDLQIWENGFPDVCSDPPCAPH